MAKRFGFGLALVAAVLVGIYLLRMQLLSAAINRVLVDTELELLQLEHLEVGLEGLSIDQMAFAFGPDRAPQSLQHVQIQYSVFPPRVHELAIERAILQLPANRDTTPSVTLTDLLNQILQLPLESALISALELNNWSHPLLRFPLAIDARWQQGRLAISASQDQQILQLTLQGKRTGGLAIEMGLAAEDEQIVALEVDLSVDSAPLEASGTGQLALGPTADFITPLMALPEPVSAIAGSIPFQLHVVMDNTPSADGLVRATLKIADKTDLALTAGVDPGWQAKMAIRVPQGLTLDISGLDQDVPKTSITAQQVDVTLSEALHQLEIQGSLEHLSCSLPQQTCLAMLSAQGQTAQTVLDQNLQMQRVAFTTEAAATIDNHQIQLELAPGELLSIGKLQRGEIRANDVVLRNEDSGRLQYRWADGALSFSATTLNLQLPRVRLPELNLATNARLEALDLSLVSDRAASGTARLVAEGINIQRPEGWLPAMAIDAQVELHEDLLSLDAQLGSGRSRELVSLTADYSLVGAQLTGQLTTNDISFAADSRRLSDYFASWPYPWDIMQGTLALSADLAWPSSQDKPVLEATISSNWENLAGNYNDIGFFNMDGRAVGTFLTPNQLIISNSARISLERLDIGVPIENITARFRLDSQRQYLRVSALEARLFGGRVWTQNANYRANRSHNRIDIGVDGLQLAQLLAATGYDAIEGTGSISGLLPINIGKNGITMTRGMLAAKDPGGVFRYQTELASDSNAAITQISEALSNYHYTIFQTEADYRDNGDLELSMQLRGHNPDMATSRPIHLNLNLVDNIPMLLRSLQSGRNIADLVSKKVEGSNRQR